MGSRLRAIYEATDWKADPNKPAERVEYYRQMLKVQKLKLADAVQVELQLAVEMLQAGDSAGAVEVLEGLRKQVADAKLRLPAEFENRVRHTTGIAYLRLGEQENCASMPGSRACIFPLRGSGVHKLPRGAAGAAREYTAMLNANPEDWEAMWLLNVAYMQLGRYPQDVPKAWLVPESRFRSDADIGDFANVSMAAGLDRMGRSGGVVMEDLDGDGLLDVVMTSSGPMDQMRFFHNNGDGTFEDRTAAAGLMGEVGGLNVIAADYDNDGHVDLLVLRGAWWGKYGEYPMSLLRNRGDGTFEDVTVRAGLAPQGAAASGPTQTAAWADYDGDGRLDLFVGHESEVGAEGTASAGTVKYPSQMFHNNGDGTFTEVARQLGLRSLGFVKGVAWGDFNNDGRPDLYVSLKGGRNRLFRNDGVGAGEKWRFTDVTATAGVAEQTNSFATWFFDYDNDGWPDIFVAGYSAGSMEDVGAFELGKAFNAETSRLYRNNHDGTFTDVAAKVGLDRAILTMGAGFGDLDNDGFLDVYLGTGEPSYEALLPNRMFRNEGGRRFIDVTTSGGFGHLQKGHGVAFGDVGNNGHEDVFEVMGGAYPGDAFMPALYKNPGNGNRWVTLELEGVKANRTAVGARVDVTIAENGALRHVVRWVGWGSSFGYSPLRQHVGLGKAGAVTRVEVRWPGSGSVQRFGELAAEKTWKLREGDAAVEVVGRKSFAWGAGQMGTMRQVSRRR